MRAHEAEEEGVEIGVEGGREGGGGGVFYVGSEEGDYTAGFGDGVG